MEELYFDPSQPGTLGGREIFYRYHDKKKTSKKQFPYWESYTIHKPISSRKFKRNKTHGHEPNLQWQADLADVGRLAKENKGAKFWLTVLDVFTRFAHVRTLKNKTGEEVAAAFGDIFKHLSPEQIPKRIQTDQGKEFLNKHVQRVFKKYGIRHFFTHSPDIKAALVERFNRTFKTRLYRHLTSIGGKSYLPVLQKLVDSYNKTVHSALDGLTPEEASHPKNFEQQWEHQNHDLLESRGKIKPIEHSHLDTKFKVGDMVRISRSKTSFNKGYLPNWSEEVFTVAKIIYRRPVVYQLVDLEEKEIGGVFYNPELQLVKGYDKDLLKVNVLRRKTDKKTGEKQALIHYRGYPETSTKWIAERDLE